MSEHVYTSEHVKRWQSATDQVSSAKARLVAARDTLTQVEAAFAKHLAPNDMKFGEEIGVWCKVGFREEQVITVKRVHADNADGESYVIEKRGDVKHVSD